MEILEDGSENLRPGTLLMQAQEELFAATEAWVQRPVRSKMPKLLEAAAKMGQAASDYADHIYAEDSDVDERAEHLVTMCMADDRARIEHFRKLLPGTPFASLSGSTEAAVENVKAWLDQPEEEFSQIFSSTYLANLTTDINALLENTPLRPTLRDRLLPAGKQLAEVAKLAGSVALGVLAADYAKKRFNS